MLVVDRSVTKTVKTKLGDISFFKCHCPCCKTCWYRQDTETCMYGGPYGGYEKVDNGAPIKLQGKDQEDAPTDASN